MVLSYFDGDWLGGGGAAPLDVSNDHRLVIGGTDQDHGGNFEGLLEDVTIWNRALSAEELIPTRYNLLTGTEPGLVGYWPMDESFSDLSPTSNTGTPSGAVSFVQIFHCDEADGANDYAYVRIGDQSSAGARLAPASSGPVTRMQKFDVAEGTPGLIGTLVTGVADFTFPNGVTLTVTDPGGTSCSSQRNDERAFIEMAGNSIRLMVVLDPMPGSWVVQSVPSSSIRGSRNPPSPRRAFPAGSRRGRSR
jgi:hypothetical protein